MMMERKNDGDLSRQGQTESKRRRCCFHAGAPGIAKAVLPMVGEEWLQPDGTPTRAGLLMVSVPLGMTAGFCESCRVSSEQDPRVSPPAHFIGHIIL
jgi:hypothetical protein